MAATILIDFLGTEDFFDRWSGDAEAKIASVKDWCESTWSQVEDGSGEYEASFYAWGDTVQVPAGALSGGDLEDRVQEADRWLRNNWYYYDSSDAVVVADYYGDSSHGTHAGLAGSNFYDVALYDCYFEDNGEIVPEYHDVGSAGVAHHELSHMFTAGHADASIRSRWFSPDEVSVLYSPREAPDCSVNGSPDTVADIKPAYPGQHDVEQDQVWRIAFDGLDCSRAGLHVPGLEPFPLQVQLQSQRDGHVIFHDQNGLSHDSSL